MQEILPGFGALIVGYARQKRCAEAVELLRRFNRIGGVPDKFMLETVLRSCLTTGEVCTALLAPPPLSRPVSSICPLVQRCNTCPTIA